MGIQVLIPAMSLTRKCTLRHNLCPPWISVSRSVMREVGQDGVCCLSSSDMVEVYNPQVRERCDSEGEQVPIQVLGAPMFAGRGVVPPAMFHFCHPPQASPAPLLGNPKALELSLSVSAPLAGSVQTTELS